MDTRLDGFKSMSGHREVKEKYIAISVIDPRSSSLYPVTTLSEIFVLLRENK
jgi:hypothetical protein